MSKFFEFHCQSRAHCEVCRQRINGKVWRIMLMDAFEDVQTPDFECPNGHPIVDDMPTPSYEEACKAIDAAEDTGLWSDLKHARRNHAQAIEQHPEHSDCWRKKQQNRVINMYLVVVDKMNKGKES